jgi:hypothetical protein
LSRYEASTTHSPQPKETIVTTIWNLRTAMSGLLALSLLAGFAGKSMAAVENDNDRSTYSAKKFYEKLDQQGGSGGN